MREVIWLEVLRGHGRSRRAVVGVLAVSTVVFVLVFVLRGLVHDPNAAVLVLLCLPVTLVAVSFGLRAGLVGAVAALACVALWDVTGGDPGGPVGYVSRAAAFLTLGVVPGWFAERLLEAQRNERETAARLSSVVDTVLDSIVVGVAVRDTTGRIVDFRVEYGNQAAADVYGRQADQLVGRTWSELWPESLGGDLFQAQVRTVEERLPFERLDWPYLGPSGEVVTFLDLRIAPLGDGYVVAWRDVTARHQDTEALTVAAERFTAAFENAPTGMALLDGGCVLRRVNQGLASVTGHAPADLVGTRLDDLLDPRDAPTCREWLALLASEQPLPRVEVRLMTADNASRWVAMSAAPVHGMDGDRAVLHVEDVDERKSFEGRLQHLADHDALTGLFNRRRFQEEVEHHLALNARYGERGAVVLLDLDNFKYVNDTLGHQTGDRLIQAAARALRARLRDSDVVARLGGDEFAVLLPLADEARAVSVTDALLAGIRDAVLEHDGRRVRGTGSAGVALVDERQAVAPEDLMANADLAMYAAKEAGRDCFVVFDPEGPQMAQSRARFRWIDRIRDALEEDGFVLHGQPILDLTSGTVSGCELLLRMQDDGDLIGPEVFLYIAERHGLASSIDRHVIGQAIDLAAAQRRPPGFRWEINLSADSLGDPEIPKLIEAKVADTRIDPSSLVFEITETAAITNMDEAQQFAGRLTDIGCRFALDDFGAGYGSFYYLKHLPFEYLKIDGEFVRELATSRTDRVIVQAIVEAAHRLGKQTIAEYVGDQATLDLLRRLHVDHAQGFHVGRPTDPLLAS